MNRGGDAGSENAGNTGVFDKGATIQNAIS